MTAAMDLERTMNPMEPLREAIRTEIARANPLEGARTSLELIAESSVRPVREGGTVRAEVVDETGQPRMVDRNGVQVPFTLRDLVEELCQRHPTLFRPAAPAPEAPSVDPQASEAVTAPPRRLTVSDAVFPHPTEPPRLTVSDAVYPHPTEPPRLTVSDAVSPPPAGPPLTLSDTVTPRLAAPPQPAQRDWLQLDAPPARRESAANAPAPAAVPGSVDMSRPDDSPPFDAKPRVVATPHWVDEGSDEPRPRAGTEIAAPSFRSRTPLAALRDRALEGASLLATLVRERRVGSSPDARDAWRQVVARVNGADSNLLPSEVGQQGRGRPQRNPLVGDLDSRRMRWIPGLGIAVAVLALLGLTGLVYSIVGQPSSYEAPTAAASSDAGTTGSITGPRVPGANPSALTGVPEIIDTATLQLQGKIVRLMGVEWTRGAGEPDDLARYLRGRSVSCEPVKPSSEQHRCNVDGQDLSKVVLYNGGGRATSDATPELLAAEAHARSTRTGLWGRQQAQQAP